MTTIEVQLSGGNGSRTTEVNQPDAESRERAWARISKSMAVETTSFPTTPKSTPPAPAPTIEKVFDAFLPQHIQATRWSRYIVPGSASRVFDGSLFVYHNPCANFWNLYNLAKGLFSEVGIRLLKSGCAWEARIPIDVLTDKMFVDSGLAAVEKTLLRHTGNFDPTPDTSAARCPAKPTVREIELTRGMKQLNESVAAEKAYWDRWDVEAKRRVAMRLDAERVEQQAEADACDTSELGEKYGMQFSDFQTITGKSKHLSADALIDENGDWLERCYWAFPTDSFWVAWRKAKNALKATGYETIKLAGIWLVYIWR